MCTAVTYRTKDWYFGRNLDYEYSYEEQVVVTPRNYKFKYRNGTEDACHYAIIGTAYVVDEYPLYYDATNEYGLSMAGLLFAGNAVYEPWTGEKENITPFELIPYILSSCKNMDEVKKCLKTISIWKENFSEKLPLSPLHWMIADEKNCIVLENTKDGMAVYDNPINVLTNNPPFPFQMMNLHQYAAISPKNPINSVPANISRECCFPTECYSQGRGGVGLPGDFSSTSRFVKAAFVRNTAVSGETESESVNQFFHILASVEQVKGCVILENNTYEKTIYSSCCNAAKGIYYYKTYENSNITAVDMRKENLDGDKLIAYPFNRMSSVCAPAPIKSIRSQVAK